MKEHRCDRCKRVVWRSGEYSEAHTMLENIPKEYRFWPPEMEILCQDCMAGWHEVTRKYFRWEGK